MKIDTCAVGFVIVCRIQMNNGRGGKGLINNCNYNEFLIFIQSFGCSSVLLITCLSFFFLGFFMW